jgi:hypothetical protein
MDSKPGLIAWRIPAHQRHKIASFPLYTEILPIRLRQIGRPFTREANLADIEWRSHSDFSYMTKLDLDHP